MQSGAIYLPLTPKLLLTPGELHSLLEADTIMINVKTGFTKPRVRKKWPNMATLYHSNAIRIMLAPRVLLELLWAILQHSDFVGYLITSGNAPRRYVSIDHQIRSIDERAKKFDGWLFHVARSEARSDDLHIASLLQYATPRGTWGNQMYPQMNPFTQQQHVNYLTKGITSQSRSVG